MNLNEAIDEVEHAIEELREKNKLIPIIVEGKKDKKTLERLGINGPIIIYNKGKSLTDFCDWVASVHQEVIILTDWDTKGGMLCHRMMELFEGRVRYDTLFRERFAKYTMIKIVEGLYSWIQTMKRHIKDNTKA